MVYKRARAIGGCVLEVGQASRLTSNDLRPQAGRPHYIVDVQPQAAFGIKELLKRCSARVVGRVTLHKNTIDKSTKIN